MRKAGLLIFLWLWLIFSPIISYSEDDSFCQRVHEKCVSEVLMQDWGWIKTALALGQCDQLYYQCLFIDKLLPWFLLFLPYVR